MPSNDDNQGMKVWWICLRAPLNPQRGFMAHGGWKTLLNGRFNGPGKKTSNGSWWRHGRVLSSPCWSYLAGIFIGDCKRRRPRGRLTRIANNNWEHCKYCNKYTTFSPRIVRHAVYLVMAHLVPVWIFQNVSLNHVEIFGVCTINMN